MTNVDGFGSCMRRLEKSWKVTIIFPKFVAEEAAAVVQTMEHNDSAANVHNFDDLAAACIADSEDDLVSLMSTHICLYSRTCVFMCMPQFQMVHTSNTSDDEDVKPNIDDIAIKLEPDSQATLNTAESPDVSSQESATQPSARGAPSTGVVVVRRDDVLRTTAMLAAARQVRADSNFDAHRLQDDNRGYQLLQRHGWQPGDKIGRNGDGIAEPIQ